VTAAYLAAVAAVDAGREVVMWLTADGVRLADEGYVDAIQTVWAPPVAELHRRFVEGGGRFYCARWPGRAASSTPAVWWPAPRCATPPPS